MPIDKIYVLGPEGTYSGYAARRYGDWLKSLGHCSSRHLRVVVLQAFSLEAKDGLV